MHLDADCVIVGAGPAGCAAAYDLAEAGRCVLLLDRRSFPRDKACACGLTRKTLKALRYPVTPVTERDCKEIVLEEAAAPRVVRVRSRRTIAAMAVRKRFDAFCLEQTLTAGRNGGAVQFMKIGSLAGITQSHEDVMLECVAEGVTHTLRSSVLIGADGSNGQTRRLLFEGEPEWFTRGFAIEACVPYSALPSQLPARHLQPTDLVFDFAPLPNGYGWMFPKSDHINVGVGVFAGDAADAALVTRRLLDAFTLEKLGVTVSGLGCSVIGQHLGMGGERYAPTGRVLLVGDAAGLVDPLTGEGIHSAVISGQSAAAAVLAGGDVAAQYAKRLQPLQRVLAFSTRAARSFYRNPQRGFRAVENPVLRSLVLRTYADGLPATRVLQSLAKVLA